MDATEALTALGGVATRRALLAAISRGDLQRALAAGTIVRRARNSYALPAVEQAVTTAHALGGVLCLTSAALHHGWPAKHVPDEPHVSVPRNRKVARERRAGLRLHRHDLARDDVDGIATSRQTTLLHCLRSLPFDEALCIADSAARDGELAMLNRVARSARGRTSCSTRSTSATCSPAPSRWHTDVQKSSAAGVPPLDARARQTFCTSARPSSPGACVSGAGAGVRIR